jgi:hypothetical protein
MDKKEKAEALKENFDKLLITENPKQLIKTGNKEISKVEVEEIIIGAVEKAIRDLQNNKEAGTYGIYSELIKYGGDRLLNRIYELERRKEYLQQGKKK